MPVVRLTLGIDEAGRGPAIGPMVVAAVALDTRAARALTRKGLRDSKSYGAGPDARAKRAEMAARVRELATYVQLEAVPAAHIDERVSRGELNVLEREIAARLIDAGPTCHRIIADGKRMFAPLAARYQQFESWDEGESRHAAVAAASVVAKVHRDTLYEQITARFTDEFGEIIGGGYVNAGTKRFIRAYVERYKALPPETRHSWPHPYVRDLIGDTRPPGPQVELPLTSE
jgi:ribonuclease HII